MEQTFGDASSPATWYDVADDLGDLVALNRVIEYAQRHQWHVLMEQAQYRRSDVGIALLERVRRLI
jgi:hypothetical protein